MRRTEQMRKSDIQISISKQMDLSDKAYTLVMSGEETVKLLDGEGVGQAIERVYFKLVDEYKDAEILKLKRAMK